MALGPLPSPGPFGRIVDMRVWPHGFTTRQDAVFGASPAGSAIIRPNLEDADWHAAGSQKWGGNIVWTGSTQRHTIAYNGPRGRWWGAVKVYDGSDVQRPFQPWFSHNGDRIGAPGGRRVLGACMRVFDELPTTLNYTGAGNGTLTLQSPATAPGVLTGDYEVRCIEAGATPRFLVTGPDATPIGVAEAGPFGGGPVWFDSVVRFTLQSGAVAFAVGDTWTLTVEEAEQFVVLVQAMSGPISGPDYAAADEVYRRGVSQGGQWTLLDSIPAQQDEYFPVPQPWFINANGTHAVTTRTVKAQGTESSGLVRLVDLDLQTFAVTREDQGGNSFGWQVQIEGGSGTAIKPLSMQSATLWRDWDGNSIITCREETQFQMSHTWLMGTSGDGTFYSANGEKYSKSDLVITYKDGEWRRTVREDTISASWDNSTSEMTSRRTIIQRPVHAIAISGSSVIELMESDGRWIYNGDGVGWPEIFTTAETTEVKARGILIAGRSGGGTYPTEYPSLGLPAAIWQAFDFNYLGPRPEFFLYSQYDPAPEDFADAAGNGPRIGYDSGALLSILGAPMAFLTPNVGGQSNNRLPATIGSTWAIDSRDNFISVVEIPIISGGYQPQSMFPLAGGNNQVAGSIGSGTYLIQSGGPDNLTPAQVHTLTDHPGSDIWGIGAF